MRRRQTAGRVGPPLLLSALLHATLVLIWLLLAARRPPEPGAVSPPSFDMVMEQGTPEGKADETRPSEIPSPPIPMPPPAQPPMPPSRPAPPAPPQADASVRLSLAAPPLDAPPEFKMPQPSPPPAPVARAAEPAFPPPMDISLARPSDNPVPRAMRGTGAMELAIGRAARDSNGPPPRDTAAKGMIHVRGANVGKDWLERLHEWWETHSYYPTEAARRAEDGVVQIHVRVDRYGRVRQVELESSSGSQWLDAGAQAVFRNAVVPPFPQSTPEPMADLDITIDYVMVGKGRR